MNIGKQDNFQTNVNPSCRRGMLSKNKPLIHVYRIREFDSSQLQIKDERLRRFVKSDGGRVHKSICVQLLSVIEIIRDSCGIHSGMDFFSEISSQFIADQMKNVG